MRIIVPAKNEATRIEATVREYCSYFGQRAIVMVVANGCTDDTSAVVERLRETFPTLELMTIDTPIGKGGAVRAGMTVGREPFVAFVDADGSAKAPQLDWLAGMCSAENLAGIIGSRWLPDSLVSRKQPLKRRIASRAFNTLIRLLFGLPYSDTQCGAKVFRRESIVGVLDHLEVANFAFDVDLLVAMKRFRYVVREAPIVWADQPVDSKVALLQAGPSMVASLVRLWLSRSIFAQLPFVDRFGRRHAIPVMRGLDVLVLERAGASEHTERVVREIRARGHRATVYRFAHPGDVLQFVWWYGSFAHRTYHVIVDLMGDAVTRSMRFTAKPRIISPTPEHFQTLDFDSELAAATKACGFHAVFWREADRWVLPISGESARR